MPIQSMISSIQINNLHILIHTMFGTNFNSTQLLSNLREQQIRNSVQQLHMQIKILQSRIAQELYFNRLIRGRVSQQPQIQNSMNFNPPDFEFCFKDQIPLEDHQATVKKQYSQKFPEDRQAKIVDQAIKSCMKTNEKEEYAQKGNLFVKVQSNSDLKLQEKQQSQHDQNPEKNETKNIPKNYGKAILSFIQKNVQKYMNVVKPILHRQKLTVSDFLNHVKKHKKQVNSIHYLKLMWGFQNINDPIFKCIRILSYTFMRKYCLSYIFNSRVKNYNTHIKYRKRMLQGIQNPAQFTCIKQF